MAGEASKSEVQSPSDPNPTSVEATIESSVGGAAESTCNNISFCNAESSLVSSEGERKNSLEYAEELIALGSKAAKEHDYAAATDYYSRALEIRAAHFGELAPECVNAYYKYGCALLYKAQEEADPLDSMPKKEDVVSQGDSHKDGSVNSKVNGESSTALVSNNVEDSGNTHCVEATPNSTADGEAEEGEGESDAEDLADGEEDESDLDLAWKMLDVARAIVEKQSGDTIEKVDILSALAEVALEREDIETSLSDYLKALTILERLVEPDSRLIAELNFRICLCLEIGSKPEEAIPYCQKAVSVCNSRVQRLTDELKKSGAEEHSSTSIEAPQASTTSVPCELVEEKEAEIETLIGLSGELEKKLEDLQQLVSNPKSILSDILGLMSAKAKEIEKNAASVGAGTGGNTSDQTSGSSGVTHLGVVGRGVKRVLTSSTVESAAAPLSKKPAVDPALNNGDGSANSA